MQSITLITLIAFAAQANANEVAANDMDDSQADQLVDQVLNKLASKLLDRVLTAAPAHDEDMDTTTLGKPAHNLEVPAQANPSSHFAPSSPDKEEVIIIEEEPEDGDALAYVLGLRGGAMKAMKKAPAMKSPAMKATKKAPAMKAPAAPAMKAPAMKKR